MPTRFVRSRRGFTVVEMITVTIIIAVLASIVVGRLQNSRDGIQFQKAIQNIESSANKAKSQAIQTGQTYVLTFDDSTQSLKVEPFNTTDSTNEVAPPDNPENAGLGSGWSVYEVRKSDGSTESTLSIKFYADGSAETKSAEFHSAGAAVTISVKQSGSIDVKRGSLAEQENQEWEAGNIEQRTTL